MTDRRITVVCTGRGRHPRRRLGELAYDDEPRIWWVVGPKRTPSGAHVGAYLVGVDHPHLYDFHCHLCSRHTEMRVDRWGDKLIQLHDAGATELDISRLPF